MTKVASSFALSLWLGFYAVTGLSELAHLAGINHIGSQALEPAAGATPVQSAFVALVALGAAGVIAATLAFLRSSNLLVARRGEAFAFGSIGLASATVVAASLFGAPFSHVFDRVDLAFWALFLSVVALVFDHAVTIRDDVDDDMAFRKALAALERPSDHRSAMGGSHEKDCG